MSRTWHQPKTDTIIARTHYYVDDHTKLRSQLRRFVQEFRGSGSSDVAPQDWRRRVGEWLT